MTYSILVVDDEFLAIGVVSGSVAVGSRVPYIKYPHCVVASQGYTNPALGPIIAELIQKGYTAEKALNEALKKDMEPELRQVAVITKNLDKAVFTGQRTLQFRDEFVGDNFIVIGNLVGKEVVKAVAKAFLESKGELVERILNALSAGHNAGGDLRGDKSAAIIIKGPTPYSPYYNTVMDIRVDYSENPIEDLKKISKLLKPAKTAKTE